MIKNPPGMKTPKPLVQEQPKPEKEESMIPVQKAEIAVDNQSKPDENVVKRPPPNLSKGKMPMFPQQANAYYPPL